MLVDGALWPQLVARSVIVNVPGIPKLKVLDVPISVVDVVPLRNVPDREMVHSLLGAGTLPGAVVRFHVIVTGAGDVVPRPKTMTCPFVGLVITGDPMFGAEVHVTPLGGGGT